MTFLVTKPSTIAIQIFYVKLMTDFSLLGEVFIEIKLSYLKLEFQILLMSDLYA